MRRGAHVTELRMCWHSLRGRYDNVKQGGTAGSFIERLSLDIGSERQVLFCFCKGDLYEPLAHAFWFYRNMARLKIGRPPTVNE